MTLAEGRIAPAEWENNSSRRREWLQQNKRMVPAEKQSNKIAEKKRINSSRMEE